MRRLQEKPTVQRRHAGCVELGLVCMLVRLATTAHVDGPETSRDILDKNKTLPKDGLKAVRWLFSETAGQSETSPHSRQPLMSYPA